MSPAAFEWIAANEEDTDRLGRSLASVLARGDVVALVGDLGAGKTRLVRAIATGMEVDPDDVQSPTFVLIREYDGRLPLYHFDTYRLDDLDEFLDLGVDEYFGGEGVCLVEWADRVRDLLPPRSIWIEITAVGPTERRLLVRADDAIVSKLTAALENESA